MEHTTFRIYQSFEIFGDTCEIEISGNEYDAKSKARDVARDIADWLFETDEWGDTPETGMSNEIEFCRKYLADKPLSADNLIDPIIDHCIVIEPTSQDAGDVKVYMDVYENDCGGVDIEEYADFIRERLEDEVTSFFDLLDVDTSANVIVDVNIIRHVSNGSGHPVVEIENDTLYDSEMNILSIDETICAPTANDLWMDFNN